LLSSSSMRIAIIIGSARPGRHSEAVARWALDIARRRRDAEFELLDIAEQDLPLLDEPLPPIFAQYTHEHTRKWAAKIGAFDGYVFVTPEYNHGYPAALKNAIDFLHVEWNHKAAGFVSYGEMGGVRAVEQLRVVMGELQVADVRSQVALSLITDFENFSLFKPHQRHIAELNALLDQVIAWSRALKPLRVSTTEEFAERRA